MAHKQWANKPMVANSDYRMLTEEEHTEEHTEVLKNPFEFFQIPSDFREKREQKGN